MATKPGFVNINLTIPIPMRDALKADYVKIPRFWENLGQFFVSIVANLTRAELEEVKKEFPLAYEFVEDCL